VRISDSELETSLQLSVRIGGSEIYERAKELRFIGRDEIVQRLVAIGTGASSRNGAALQRLLEVRNGRRLWETRRLERPTLFGDAESAEKRLRNRARPRSCRERACP